MKFDHRFDVRVDEQTKKTIEDNAVSLGLSVSSYVRMLLLKGLGVK